MYVRRVTTIKAKRKHGNPEHELQKTCVNWFRLQYPSLYYCLFAVPNGGRRDKATGAMLKAEGVLAGVSDLILLKSNRDYDALCIEMKTSKGRQSEAQKQWQKAIEREGCKYVVCRSLSDFMQEVRKYLSNMKKPKGLQSEVYKYVLCRSVEELIEQIKLYFSNK